jgi:hypothetical protein
MEDSVKYRNAGLGAALAALASLIALPSSTVQLRGQAPSGAIAMRRATERAVTRERIGKGTNPGTHGDNATQRC